MWAVYTLIWVILDIWKSDSKRKKEINKVSLGNGLDLLKREKMRHFLPNQRDLYVYPVSELPYPNLPRRGQNNDNSMNGRNDDHIETPARHLEYGDEFNRFETFSNWPHQSPTPQALSNAGFVFEAGHDDFVRCFSCGGGLRDWEPLDDPWIQHCRWFPNCPFALSVKGADYISSVQADMRMEEIANNAEIQTEQVQRRLFIDIRSRERPLGAQALLVCERDEKDIDALKRENEMLKRKIMCVECRRHIDAVLIPCGHLIMCFNCAKECITCPICMEATTKIQKICW